MTQGNDRLTRRAFVSRGSKAAAGMLAGAIATRHGLVPARAPGDQMKFGLVTYQWGRDWDLPALIRNCQKAGVYGVELRVDHAHDVHAGMSPRERAEVRLRFANSPVEPVGIGANWEFHSPDVAELQENIAGAKADAVLAHDIGATGVKVKPNTLPEGVPAERTIAQIARSLDNVGRFAADYGQEIRVEVHGRTTQQLPVMRQIFELVEEPNVKVCWNSNAQDLDGEGLAHNFDLVDEYFGQTSHVREFDVGDYPYQDLIDLFVGIDYDGWVLLEARTEPENRITALAAQRALFDEMVARAQRTVQAG